MLLPQMVRTTKDVIAKHAPYLHAPVRDAFKLTKSGVQRVLLTSAKWRRQKKLVLGAGNVMPHGWIPSDYPLFDCCNETHWARYFKPASLDALLAEHMFEHLDMAKISQSVALCYAYLKPGAALRAAVPDGWHPDAAYRELVGVNGPHEHKQLFTAQSFSALFESAGFVVTLLEYHDEGGRFHEEPWTEEGGCIRRSSRHGHDTRGPSIILDARKPA